MTPRYMMTQADFENISRIFYPDDKYKLPFTSKWEHTRVNIGYHIFIEKFPVAFSHSKYFEYHHYLMYRAKTTLGIWEKMKLNIKGELPRLEFDVENFS